MLSQKINETCKNYFKIEKPEKYIIFNSLNECFWKPIRAIRCLYLTIWRFISLGKWWWIIAYTKIFFFYLNVPKISSTFRLISIQLIFIYEVNWEMAKTQREWITPAAAPLQRSHGVVAVSMEYQNKNKKIGDGYVIAATFKLHTKSTYLMLILIFYISQIFKNNSWSLEKIHLNMAHYHP